MISAPKPSDELGRLETLRSYGILDTPPEERFDRVVRLVSRHLAVSTAAVSLIDLDRQWFKASVGLGEATESPRDLAFCSHAILQDSTLVVENALDDERFADHPFVTEAPALRFYAGAPLIAPNGHRLGTLCAIDGSPRKFTSDEELFLRDMAAIVVDEMELSVSASTLTSYSEALVVRNRSLDAFVHTLSHDLAGPIHRIRSFCDMIGDDASFSTEECIQYISASADTADRLLKDLRSFFVVDRGDVAIECDTQHCLDSALGSLSETIQASGCHVEVTGELPTLQLYPGLLISLFQNLISNGIKYRGQEAPRITVHGVDRGDTWECSVGDNGMGIDKKHQEQVFELLFRLHSQSEIPGSGMGLAICDKIVRGSGGALTLESTPGEGTCVTFSLPKEAGASQAT